VDVSAATPGYGDYEGSTVRVNGTPVYESHYEHDALGRITEWTETVEGSTRVQRFEYDDGGRLTSVRDGLDAPVADYGYDLNGNRTSVVESARRVLELGVNLGCPDSGGVPLARGANDRDELCRHGDHDYTYDANGRLQSRVNVANPQDETVYTYDGGGRLQAVAHGSTTIAYVHDALGRRVGRVVNGAFERGWLYKDSLNPIAQVNAAGVVEATYVYVTRANVPDYIVTTAGAVYRVVSDHLGSVRMLVNATTGAVVERYDYDVWGRVTFESGDHSLHPFGYAGGLYDADTGLVRFGVRDYDADAGRWTAPEPLGFAAEANWYRYAGGDPVNFIDRTGREFEPWNWGWQDIFPFFASNDDRGGSVH
jgi:RHS repeat-associated protein